MGEDASLDEFLNSESSEQSGAADADASTTDTEPAGGTVSPDIDPATTTYAWSDGAATCGTCGEAVERRWQQAGDLVCVECKDWDRA